VELDHAGRGGVDDPGLALVAGDHKDLGALHLIGQQPIQPEGGGKRRLPVAGGDAYEPLARSRLV